MKKIQTIIFALVFTMIFTVIGQAASPKSIDTVMSEIRIEQGVASNEQINTNTVSQGKLEELGDSVMEAMIGNSEIHEQMDERMGGEGSAALTAMHVRMGYNYLVNYPYGMIGPGNPHWGGMMGYYGWNGMAILGFFLIVLIVILIVVLRRLTKDPMNKSTETPLDILNRRYAKGEITKEEYEKIMEDLIK